ncbi:nuclear speckle splicing regulatory protein 1 [Wyeomyia smithii]|uniref:nuclear speckle splicing regulatory protein 1 n=1 Tax=Wyeomyia smithii TaxID=174621 RepID=UPI002467DBFA|nr:nuclear speckle splicing regulatory protein 1 [Wyeomyia smithii]
MSKQYGLIDPKAIRASKTVLKKPTAFESDSDSDATTPRHNIKAELGECQKRQAARAQEKALAEDPTIYQYDELYDEMDGKRKEAKTSKSKEERKPKYIGKLLETAEKRKKEQERRIERQVQKEREAEGEMFKDKESFVTSAYRAKLEEMKEAEEQEKREEYLESIGDVTKQDDLGGFYRHIYSQKVGESSVKIVEPQIDNRIKSSDSEDDTNDKNERNVETDSKKVLNQAKHMETMHPRKYRKRRSDEDDNIDAEKNDHSNKIHLHSNLDADSDFSIDSNSSSSETGSSSESSDNEDAKGHEDKPKDGKFENKSIETEPDGGPKNGVDEKLEEDVKPTNGTDAAIIDDVKTHKKEVKKKESKVDIWKKRTIGAVFDAALQRYYERKAARESG